MVKYVLFDDVREILTDIDIAIDSGDGFDYDTWRDRLEELSPVYLKTDSSALGEIKAEIEQIKSVMNEEIINNDRKDLINFVNGLNQCMCIIDSHISEKRNHE